MSATKAKAAAPATKTAKADDCPTCKGTGTSRPHTGVPCDDCAGTGTKKK